jgi:hypothetical protein
MTYYYEQTVCGPIKYCISDFLMIFWILSLGSYIEVSSEKQYAFA